MECKECVNLYKANWCKIHTDYAHRMWHRSDANGNIPEGSVIFDVAIDCRCNDTKNNQ